jgi:hypothetical protein
MTKRKWWKLLGLGLLILGLVGIIFCKIVNLRYAGIALLIIGGILLFSGEKTSET